MPVAWTAAWQQVAHLGLCRSKLFLARAVRVLALLHAALHRGQAPLQGSSRRLAYLKLAFQRAHCSLARLKHTEPLLLALQRLNSCCRAVRCALQLRGLRVEVAFALTQRVPRLRELRLGLLN